MKENNVILDKSFQFGLRIVKLFRYLREKKIERELCIQLLKSGTSIGANVEEAVGGTTKRDFIFKLSIAYKEARETRYWLRIFRESRFIDDKLAVSFIGDCEELIKILTVILNSSKQQDNGKL